MSDSKPDPPPLVGSLHTGPTDESDVRTSETPKVQPAAFWKAFGYSLLPLLSISGSLLDADQALFLPALGQPGVPEGGFSPKEVTNYHLFVKGDAVQTLNQPTFMLSGQPSYFEMIYLYLRYRSTADETPELKKIRAKLFQAEQAKNAAWNQARVRYSKTDTSKRSFVDYLGDDNRYIAAWQREQFVQNEFYRLRGPEMQDIDRQIEIMKSANDRLVFRQDNTMPVVAVDVFDNDVHGPAKPSVDPKDIYYRPSYSILNYVSQFGIWQRDTNEEEGPFLISLSKADQQTWSGLGHPLVDQANPKDIGEDIKALYEGTRIEMYFPGGRPVALDITRGVWEYPGFRSSRKLDPSAPEYLNAPFCKTVKLIMAWGIRLFVTVPPGLSEDREARLIESLALPPMDKSGGRYEFTAGAEMCPILLAALARVA